MSQRVSGQGVGDNDDTAIARPIAVLQPLADEATATSGNGLYRTMTVNMNGVVKRLMVPMSGIRDLKKNQTETADRNARSQTAKRSGPPPTPRELAELNRRKNTGSSNETQCYQIAPRPVTTQVIAPVSRPVTTQVIAPVSRPVTTQVIAPVSRPVTTQVIAPVSRPATTQIIAPVSRPATTRVIGSSWTQPTLVLSPTGQLNQKDGTTFALQSPITASTPVFTGNQNPRNYSYFSKETGRILQLSNNKNKFATSTAKTSSTTASNQVQSLPVQYVQSMATALSVPPVAMMQQPSSSVASGVPMLVMPGQTPASNGAIFKTAMQSRGTPTFQAVSVSNASKTPNLPGSQQQHPMHVNFAVSMPGKSGQPSQPLPLLGVPKNNPVSPAVRTNQPLILSHNVARRPVAPGSSLPFLIIPSTGGNNQPGTELTPVQAVTTLAQPVMSTGTPAVGTHPATNPGLYQVMNVPTLQRKLDAGSSSNKTNPQPVAFLPSNVFPSPMSPLVIQPQSVTTDGKRKVATSQPVKNQPSPKTVSQNQKITSYLIEPVPATPASTSGMGLPIVITPTSMAFRGRPMGKRGLTKTPAGKSVTSVTNSLEKSKPTPSLSNSKPTSSSNTTGDKTAKDGNPTSLPSEMRPILPKQLGNRGTQWKTSPSVNKNTNSSFEQNATDKSLAGSNSDQNKSKKVEKITLSLEKPNKGDSHKISTPKAKTKEVQWENKFDFIKDKSNKDNASKCSTKVGKSVETGRSRKCKKEKTNKLGGRKRRNREVSPSFDYALYSSKRTRLERRAKSGVKYNVDLSNSSSEDEIETWDTSEIDMNFTNYSDSTSGTESVGSNISDRKTNGRRARPLTFGESSDSDVQTEKPHKGRAPVISDEEETLPISAEEINAASHLEKDKPELDVETSNAKEILQEGNRVENLKAKWDTILGNKRNCFVRLHRINLRGKRTFKVDWSDYRRSSSHGDADRVVTVSNQTERTDLNQNSVETQLGATAVPGNLGKSESHVNSKVAKKIPKRSACPMESVVATTTAVAGMTEEQSSTAATTEKSTSRSKPLENAMKENLDRGDFGFRESAKYVASGETVSDQNLPESGADSVMLEPAKQSVTIEKTLNQNLDQSSSDSVMKDDAKTKSVLPGGSALPNKSSNRVVNTPERNTIAWKWYTSPDDKRTSAKERSSANQVTQNQLDSRNREAKTTGTDFNVLKQHDFQLDDIREQLTSLNS